MSSKHQWQYRPDTIPATPLMLRREQWILLANAIREIQDYLGDIARDGDGTTERVPVLTDIELTADALETTKRMITVRNDVPIHVGGARSGPSITRSDCET